MCFQIGQSMVICLLVALFVVQVCRLCSNVPKTFIRLTDQVYVFLAVSKEHQVDEEVKGHQQHDDKTAFFQENSTNC